MCRYAISSKLVPFMSMCVWCLVSKIEPELASSYKEGKRIQFHNKCSYVHASAKATVFIEENIVDQPFLKNTIV